MFDQLIEELSALDAVEAIALGGSRASGNNDPASDYDVYLYCTASVPLEMREAILARYCSYMELGNHYWELEDNCTLLNGIDIDVLYRNIDDFAAGLSHVVFDHEAANGYTTCMWRNLMTCKILYDRDGRLTALQQRFDVSYPDELRANIMERHWNLLHAALPAYDHQIMKAANRADLVSVNHRTAAFLESYFDLLFAYNRVLHPGEKRQIQLSMKECAVLPDHFETNLTQLFNDLYTNPDKISDDLHLIITKLEKMLALDSVGTSQVENKQ